MGSPRTEKRKARRKRQRELAAHGLETVQIAPRVWRVVEKQRFPVRSLLPNLPQTLEHPPMSLPKHLEAYEDVWIEVVELIHERGEVTLPFNDPVKAKAARFKFYGFRAAYVRHDPHSPLTASLQQAQAIITPKGDLLLDRLTSTKLLSDVLKAVGRAREAAPTPETFEASKGPELTQEQLFDQMYGKGGESGESGESGDAE